MNKLPTILATVPAIFFSIAMTLDFALRMLKIEFLPWINYTVCLSALLAAICIGYVFSKSHQQRKLIVASWIAMILIFSAHEKYIAEFNRANIHGSQQDQ